MTSATLSNRMEAVEERNAIRLRRMLVAHDGSAAANRAFADAVDLARRFHAEIAIAYVNGEANPAASPVDLDQLRLQSSVDGVQCRSIIRRGSVSGELMDICDVEQIDLLLLGAYGSGDQNRDTLGSTAESILRMVACPVVVYGPRVMQPLLTNEHAGPALLPVAVPCGEGMLERAIGVAKLFGVSVEIFHSVMNREAPHELRWFETECRVAASLFRRAGVRTEWSFLYGQPDATICAKAREVHSPFILMPLKSRKSLSSPTSDNVAASVIRTSKVPVISYRHGAPAV